MGEQEKRMKLCNITDAAGGKITFDLDQVIMISTPNILTGGPNTIRVYLHGLFFDLRQSDGEEIKKAWAARSLKAFGE